MTRPKPCPGAQHARRALCRPPNSKPRLPLFAEPIGSWIREKCPPARAVVQHVELNSATGRCRRFTDQGLGTRINFCPPWPNPAHGARSRPTFSLSQTLDTTLPQFDAILLANTPTPRSPAHPKNAWPFYPGASEPLREPVVCRPAPLLADHGNADLCHPLIRCRVGPQHRAPARADRRRHWPRLAVDVPEATRNTPDIAGGAARSASCVANPGLGSQIDLIHVSGVQLTDSQ